MTKKIQDLPMIKPDQIENLSDLNLFFIRRYGNYVSSSEVAGKAMQRFIKDHQLEKAKLRYFSISHDDPHITNEDKLRFDACIQTTQDIQQKSEVG